MEQLNNQSQTWYRFPIKIIPHEAKLLDDTTDYQEDSFYDIRADTIGGIRQAIEEDIVTGSLVYLTTGDNFYTELTVKQLRNILKYEPIKIKVDEV